MAGLLGDSWEDPRTMATLQLAAGLLGPGSFGGNASRGLLGYQQALGAAEDRAVQREYRAAQARSLATDEELKRAQIAEMQNYHGLVNGVFGAGGSQPASTGSASLDSKVEQLRNPEVLRSMSIDDVAKLKLMSRGKIDLTKEWELATVPKSVPIGYAAIPGQPLQYLPDPTKGIGYSNGQVTLLPGAVQAQAALAGATTSAQEAAKAPFTFVDGYDGATGTPVRRSVATLRAAENRAAPTGYGTESGLRSQTGGIGLDVASANRELQKLERDIQNPNLDEPSRNLLRQSAADIRSSLQRASVPQGPAIGELQSGPSAQQATQNEASRIVATTAAKGQAERNEADIKKQRTGGEMLDAIKEAKSILQQGPTASGLGAIADQANSFLGRSTKSADLASRLDIVSGTLINNVPRMEGPQSDGDRKEYAIQAGRAADRTLPVSQRMSALDQMERLQTKYATLNGGSPNTPAEQRNLLPTLPPANASNRGRKIRDTQTGEILVSDGMSWKKQ